MTNDLPQSAEPGPGDEQQAGSVRSRWAGISGSRQIILVTLAVCLVVVVVGVAVAVLSPGGGGQAGSVAGLANSPVAGGTPSARPTRGHESAAGQKTTAPPVVAGAGLAKTALESPLKLKRQMLAWRAGPGEAALSAVTAQMGYAMQAAAVKLYPSMKLTCVKLASDIRTAQAAPPIPDAAMQRLYIRALAGLSNAAADCHHAISTDASGDETLDIHLNKALFSRARAEFTTASKRIYNATAAIQALDR
jgi:hypothetical protein